MKFSICIAAFLAGIVSFCAHATPIELDVTYENDAHFRVDATAGYGLLGFERTEIRRSGIDIEILDIEVIEDQISEPVIVPELVAMIDVLPQVAVLPTVLVEPAVPDPVQLLAPLVLPQADLAGRTVPDPVEMIVPLAQPHTDLSAASRAGPVIVLFGELPDARVPEPESLLLFAAGLLMLASRRLLWR